MTGLAFDFVGADVLIPDGGLVRCRLSFAEGRIISEPVGRAVDLRGYRILPGLVDLHGDGFERHLAPRRGAMKEMGEGVIATEAELAANGITTAVMAQFHSWEGGVRSPEYAERVFRAIHQVQDEVATDLIPQLRFEISMLDDYDALPERLAAMCVSYLVFNDHLPHERLAEGRHPPRLTGQALKAGRNPDRHFEMLLGLHQNSGAVPAALDRLTQVLSDQGVRLGSHDDRNAKTRSQWRAQGVGISEFPETLAAAEAARDGGDFIILGAPNVMRGGSHKGNASALDLIAMGLCDALASDYHYPSPRRAALMLAQSGLCEFAAAWRLVSEGPAGVLGLTDRGCLLPQKRADLVILDSSGRVAATFARGRVSYMSGEIASRFFA